uniref:Isopentenyltransferase n=1 Tax=Solanum tuberosum TaxID=4113 RepID=M1DTW7_SOLTU
MGATGTGKSRLSVDLATNFRGEIINSDKMQVYKGLDIVTNKITHAEKQGVRHYLLGEIEPDSDLTAEDFCLKSIVFIENILNTQSVPIIIRGSYSYIEKLVGWWMRCGKFSFQMQITPKESDGPLVSLKWPNI